MIFYLIFCIYIKGLLLECKKEYLIVCTFIKANLVIQKLLMIKLEKLKLRNTVETMISMSFTSEISHLIDTFLRNSRF